MILFVIILLYCNYLIILSYDIHSNHHDSIFWDISDNKMIKLLDRIENDLHIFIYPFPRNAYKVERNHMPYSELHFYIQNLLITHLQSKYNKSNDNNNSFIVKNPEYANVFIIDMILLGLGLLEPKLIEYHISPTINNVLYRYPYYNRSNGYDHFIVAIDDTGILCKSTLMNPNTSTNVEPSNLLIKAFERVGNASFISNYGMNNDIVLDYNNRSITCFRPNHDIVIPQMIWDYTYYDYIERKQLGGVIGYHRKYDSCFEGRYHGKRKTIESMNDTSIYDYYNKSLENFHIERYLYNCLFGYNACGMACWSMRLYDGIAYGSTPILIADGSLQPFERFIDWRKFSVKLNQSSFDNITTLDKFRRRIRIESDKYNNILSTLLNNNTYIHIHPYDNDSNIQSNYIYNKMKYMNKAMQWFQYNHLNNSRNAFRLLYLEIWCRINISSNYSYQGLPNSYSPFSIEYKNYLSINNHKICSRRSDYTADIEYF